MAERVVAVKLQAQVANYVAGMETARKATKGNADAAVDLKAKFEEQNQAMTTIGTGMVAMGALAAVGVGMAVKKWADFDAAMSNVQASTHESEANMNLLRDAAIDAGATTVFTAREAANAIDELAKAGLSTADILGGALDGALSLASAGGIEVAQAATIAATALTQFKLKGSDIPHVADLLAAGAGKASGSVDDLSQALDQGGLVAAQAGFLIEETTGVLAAFAAAGLTGSDAGTSLKTAILALENPSTKAAETMDKYGISVYDSQGNMDSFSGIAGTLQEKLGGLTDEQRNAALATIFGNDAVRSAAVLYSEGADGIEEWNGKVNDAGYAAETAALKLDNLNGDVEKLGGAFDTALIKSGSAADGSLRLLVQSATALVDVFNGAPPIVQTAALGLGVVTAGALLTGGAFLIGVPKVAAFSLALQTLSGSSMPGVAASAAKMQGAITSSGTALSKAGAILTGPWGLAVAAAAVGVALLGSYLESLQASSDEMTNSFKSAASAADIFRTAGQGQDVKWARDVLGDLQDLDKVLQASADHSANFLLNISDQSNRGAQETLAKTGEQLASIAGTDLPEAQRQFRLLADATDGTDKRLWQLISTMPGYRDALVTQATALGINVTSTDEAANKTALLEIAQGNATPTTIEAADAYLLAAEEAAGLSDKVLALIEQVNTLNGTGQDAVSSNASYKDSLAGISDEVQRQKDEFIKLQEEGYLKTHETLDGFKGTLDGFTLSLDESTASGSANAAMLAGVAADAQAAALAQFEVDKTTMGAKEATDKYIGTLGLSREELRKQAEANGYSADEVQKLIDKVYAMPTEKQTKLLVDTATATADIDNWLFKTGKRTVSVKVTADGSYGNGLGVLLPGRASGGILPGAPSSVDNMVIRAAGGEFVTNARSTANPANRAALEYMNSGGTIHGYANGGYVQPVQYVPSTHRSGAGSSTTTNSRGDTTYNISSPADPIAVARAVSRRHNDMGAV